MSKGNQNCSNQKFHIVAENEFSLKDILKCFKYTVVYFVHNISNDISFSIFMKQSDKKCQQVCFKLCLISLVSFRYSYFFYSYFYHNLHHIISVVLKDQQLLQWKRHQGVLKTWLLSKGYIDNWWEVISERIWWNKTSKIRMTALCQDGW